MVKQKTLAREISFSGIGVHSGKPSSVLLKPSLPNNGIRIENKAHNLSFVVGTVVPLAAMHATVISYEGWNISTVEHLMAALGYLDIDNVDVVIEGEEVPILDGSSLPFAQGIESAGLVEQDAAKIYITPKMPLVFQDEEGRVIKMNPAQQKEGTWDTSLHLSYTASFNHPLIGTRTFHEVIDKNLFTRSIAPARTFGFLSQLPFLRKHGLSQASSLGNTVVIGDHEFLNDERIQDEWARHKMLDLLGDLALLGKRLAGTVVAEKTGHSFNRLVIEHYKNYPNEWGEITA